MYFYMTIRSSANNEPKVLKDLVNSCIEATSVTGVRSSLLTGKGNKAIDTNADNQIFYLSAF